MSNDAAIALGLLMIDLSLFEGFFTKIAIGIVVAIFIIGVISGIN